MREIGTAIFLPAAKITFCIKASNGPKWSPAHKVSKTGKD